MTTTTTKEEEEEEEEEATHTLPFVDITVYCIPYFLPSVSAVTKQKVI